MCVKCLSSSDSTADTNTVTITSLYHCEKCTVIFTARQPNTGEAKEQNVTIIPRNKMDTKWRNKLTECISCLLLSSSPPCIYVWCVLLPQIEEKSHTKNNEPTIRLQEYYPYNSKEKYSKILSNSIILVAPTVFF